MDGYDIIGDIHGHAGALRALLSTLGYGERDGVWQHDFRQAVFVGDFIDRGPEIPAVVDLVRSMVDAGKARAVLGNHELNALCYHTEDPANPGRFLRPHTEKNRHQHQETVRQYASASGSLREALEWFWTLPLWLDLGDLRVIHACWDESAVERVSASGALDGGERLIPDALPAVTRRDDPLYDDVEVLLKGPERSLPDGESFPDKDGHARGEARVKWWHDARELGWPDAAFVDVATRVRLPVGGRPTPLEGYYPKDAPPVFVGHYWLRGTPTRLAANVACLDWSVAKGGALVAYRWDGERTIRPEKFVAEPDTAGHGA